MLGRWQQGFLHNAKWGVRGSPPIEFARLPPQTKVKLSHWLTDGSPSWQTGWCVSCSVGVLSPRPHQPRARPAEEEATLRDGVTQAATEGQTDSANDGLFFYTYRKLWGGQRWDTPSVTHWAIFNLKTNKIICAGLTIHNKAGPAAVQTYDEQASIVLTAIKLLIKKIRLTVIRLNNSDRKIHCCSK